MSKRLKIILFFFLGIVLMCTTYILLPILTNPLIKYEKAWSEKDRSFFIEQISQIEKETETRQILNSLSRITSSTNYYIIEADEFDYEMNKIKDLEVYKSNIIYGLSVLFSSKILFSDEKRYLSEFRKYDRLFNIEEKKKIIELVEKNITKDVQINKLH